MTVEQLIIEEDLAVGERRILALLGQDVTRCQPARDAEIHLSGGHAEGVGISSFSVECGIVVHRVHGETVLPHCWPTTD